MTNRKNPLIFPGVSKNKVFTNLLEEAATFANINRPILIRGERGTGKELLARFIHDNSPRQEKPFITINCAAITEQLLTSEIYGHEKGAFTGADQSRIGKLEQANGGSLFMDEIGNMSIHFQQMILRVIEYQEFEKVRGTEKIKVDVRIISATNADLEELMAESIFLRDLYDRLTFAQLTIPPLRHRKEDIPNLIVHFVQNLHEEIPNLQEKKFEKETVQMMMEYHWPGNIRDLKNVTERLYLGPSGSLIQKKDLPLEISGLSPPTIIFEGTFHERVDEFKKHLISETLQQTQGKQKLAAEILQMSYDQFRHYYRKYDIK